MICKTCATAADLGVKHYCNELGCTCQHRGAEPTTEDTHAEELERDDLQS